MYEVIYVESLLKKKQRQKVETKFNFKKIEFHVWELSISQYRIFRIAIILDHTIVLPKKEAVTNVIEKDNQSFENFPTQHDKVIFRRAFIDSLTRLNDAMKIKLINFPVNDTRYSCAPCQTAMESREN